MDVDMRDVDMPMVAGLPIPSLPPKLFEDVIYTVISPPQLPGEDPGLFEARLTVSYIWSSRALTSPRLLRNWINTAPHT